MAIISKNPELRFGFNRSRNQLVIPSKGLNDFARTEIYDTTSFYQRKFGIFSFMRLTGKEKYTIHTLRGVPMVWQPHNSCTFDPTGAMFVGKRELTPCSAKLNEQFCYDELFDGCFEHLLRWNGRGPLQMTAEGEQLFDMMLNELTRQAILGARLTLTVGKTFSTPAIQFSQNAPADIKSLFSKTMGTCKGWLEVLKELGERVGSEHCDLSGVFDDSMFKGHEFVGDPVELFDKLRTSAKPQLRQVINGGAVWGNGRAMKPIMLVSQSVMNAVADAYRVQCNSINCLNPRLTATADAETGVMVYHIDGIPVIPEDMINMVDEYLTGRLHFAAITIPGNIGLGASFADVEGVLTGENQSGAGIVIEKGMSVKELGQYYVAAHQLFAAAIADSDYIVATQEYRVPV